MGLAARRGSATEAGFLSDAEAPVVYAGFSETMESVEELRILNPANRNSEGKVFGKLVTCNVPEGINDWSNASSKVGICKGAYSFSAMTICAEAKWAGLRLAARLESASWHFEDQ